MREWMNLVQLASSRGQVDHSTMPEEPPTSEIPVGASAPHNLAITGTLKPADTVLHVRKWLIVASLSVTGVDLLFFILAPALGYPLEYPQNLRLMQIVLPVVLGYLGTMTAFLFQAPTRTSVNPDALPFLTLLAKGPVILFGVATTAAIGAFGYMNRASAAPGTGMSVDTLSMTVTTCLERRSV
jgi:hypothetical protein